MAEAPAHHREHRFPCLAGGRERDMPAFAGEGGVPPIAGDEPRHPVPGPSTPIGAPALAMPPPIASVSSAARAGIDQAMAVKSLRTSSRATPSSRLKPAMEKFAALARRHRARRCARERRAEPRAVLRTFPTGRQRALS